MGGAPPPDCSPPPPPRPRLGLGRGQDSPKAGSHHGSGPRPGYGSHSRGPQPQSTFGKAATMYKAESLSLEAMRGGSNHSSFFPDQGKTRLKFTAINWLTFFTFLINWYKFASCEVCCDPI